MVYFPEAQVTCFLYDPAAMAAGMKRRQATERQGQGSGEQYRSNESRCENKAVDPQFLFFFLKKREGRRKWKTEILRRQNVHIIHSRC